MADKIEYSRLLIKRTDNSGISPTIPTGSTLSTFTDTDTFVGEFFLNSTDDRLWVRTENGQFEIMMSGNTSGITQNLGQTLVYGNQTLGNDIYISLGDRIYTTDGTDTSEIVLTPSVLDTNTTFGNIKSQLILDPEQAFNGTQLRSEDVVNNTIGLVLVRDSDILLNVDNPITNKTSSLAITDDNTQMISELYFQGYNGVGFWTKGDTTTTTGVTPTDIVSIDTGTAPFSNNRVYKVICHYTGIDSLYTSGYTTEVRGTFRNNGGTITQIGSLEYFSTRSEFTGLTDPDIYVSGDNIRGRVRGITGKDITWSVIMMIHNFG